MKPSPSRLVAFQRSHPSTAEDFDGWVDVAVEKGFARAGVPRILRHRLRSYTTVGSILRRAGLVRNLSSRSRYALVVTLPLVSERKLFPATYFSEIIPYIYDCWPSRYEEWVGLCKRNDFRVAFVSAKQSRDFLASRVPDVEFIWMPEAYDPDRYIKGKPLHERPIDVLDFGRKLEPFHSQIKADLARRGHSHSHSSYKLSNADFIKTLADAEITVCFPRSMTHPDYAKGVETLTLRYFEAMASRSIVYGHCPKELEDLYGYNPIIEADLSRPGEQLHEILSSIEKYQSLVDRNYEMTLQRGSWDQRVREIIAALRERGYAVETQASA